MNAADARRRRGGSTLLERTKSDSSEAARIDALVATISAEHTVQAITEAENVTQSEGASSKLTGSDHAGRDAALIFSADRRHFTTRA